MFIEACAEQPRSGIASQIAQRKLKLPGIPLVLSALACPVGAGMWVPRPRLNQGQPALFDSQAEGVLCYEGEVFAAGGTRRPEPRYLWLEDPPAADGRKVIISDTDHYAPAAVTHSGPESPFCATTIPSS